MPPYWIFLPEPDLRADRPTGRRYVDCPQGYPKDLRRVILWTMRIARAIASRFGEILRSRGRYWYRVRIEAQISAIPIPTPA